MADKELYSQRQIDDLLETAYDSMVILFGLDDLSSIKNVERFKRDIRVSIKTSRIIVLYYWLYHNYSWLLFILDILTALLEFIKYICHHFLN